MFASCKIVSMPGAYAHSGSQNPAGSRPKAREINVAADKICARWPHGFLSNERKQAWVAAEPMISSDRLRKFSKCHTGSDLHSSAKKRRLSEKKLK